MIDINNYQELLKDYVGIEIKTKVFVELFGTDKLKESYKRDGKMSGKYKKITLNKAKKYCIINDFGKGKFLIESIYDENDVIISYHSHPLYKTYHGMKYRCYNSNCPMYYNYGGRGILICDEWMDEKLGVKRFIQWSEENGYKPDSGLSIDRIDNNKGYSPDNCRWVDWKTQMINRRSSNGKIINPESSTSKSDYIIQNIDGVYLAYLIYCNKTYPVGTYFSEEESRKNIDELYGKLYNLG